MFTFAIRKEINSKISKINLASNKGHILEKREVISDINGGTQPYRGDVPRLSCLCFELWYCGSFTLFFFALFSVKFLWAEKF